MPSSTLTLTVHDNGNTGTGGDLVSVATSTINITAVNDAPVFAATGSTLTVVTNAGASGSVSFTEAALAAYFTDPDSATIGINTVATASGRHRAQPAPAWVRPTLGRSVRSPSPMTPL